jgi:Protein of unknown function (DUF2971).
MAKTNSPPQRIYKYRGFSDRVLDMLVLDDLYFADPSGFNDPLDTRPNLEADLPAAELERVLTRLVVERTKAEMTRAAKSIRYTGPRTVEHIDRHSHARAARLVDELRYSAGDPCYGNMADPLQYLLANEIETELLKRYDRGIVSFGTRATCPLMWSHYGDQHRGICAGYSVPDTAVEHLFPVTYGGSRNVSASDVDAMDADADARRRVDEAALLRKAPNWRYEKEWRLIGNRGSQSSSLELEEVIFGMRCPGTVRYAIVKALENRRRDVRFYEVPEPHGTFRLRVRPLETGELLSGLPRRHLDVYEHFDDLDLSASDPDDVPAAL